MAIEREAKGGPHPLPVHYKPPQGREYPVQDGDTWKTVAFKYFINVDRLIWFNFLTLNSNEVNWYLHRNVGCRHETRDRFNYVFSAEDKPGIIWIPPAKGIVFHDAADALSDRIGSQSDLGKALSDADSSGSWPDYLGFSLNIYDFMATGLAVSAVELGALGLAMDIFGAAAGLVSVALTLGGPHLGAMNDIKTGNARSGVSQGIVLGAASEQAPFIRDRFVTGSESYNTDYPDQRKNFQKAYLAGLLKGLDLGRKLTRSERLTLFKHLDALDGRSPPGDFYMHRGSKGAWARRNYYIDVAARLRAKYVN